MTVRLMHLADLHLGVPFTYLGSKAQERAKDLESAFSRALALASEKNVHAVVIAGDLFDSFDPPPELIARVKSLLAKPVQQGIPVVLIPGTHDSHRYAKSVYRREQFPGVDVLMEPGERIRKTVNGHEVFFYGFSGNRRGADPSQVFRRGEEKGIHVALVHGTVGDAAHWTPSTRDFPLTPDELEASGFQYVALGHHHNFREFTRGRVTAVYPGTLEALKFGENGDRYLIIAEISENSVRIEKTPHNRRMISEVSIDLTTGDITTVEELCSVLSEKASADAIIRVTLKGTMDFVLNPREIEAHLADRFFHIEIEDETSVHGSEMALSLASENTVRGIFVRKMLQKIEQSSGEGRAAAELGLRLAMEQFMRADGENQQTGR